MRGSHDAHDPRWIPRRFDKGPIVGSSIGDVPGIT